MNEDPRCCGSGTCIIDAEDRCWCGRQWASQEPCKTPPALAEVADGEPAEEPSRAPPTMAHTVGTALDQS